MKLITKDDNRKTAINSFDSSMDAFFKSSERFSNAIDRINKTHEYKLNIYSLAHNYYHNTCILLENLYYYKPLIANSMLTTRYECHQEILNKFSGQLFVYINHQIDIIIDFYNQGCSYDFLRETPVKTAEEIAKFDLTIDTEFNDNGFLYFLGIKDNLQQIEEIIRNLTLLNKARTASDFEDIYNRMSDDYFQSDEWEKLKNNYIIKIMQRHPDMTEKTAQELILKLNEELENDEELGEAWVAYGDNTTELSKAIVRKDYSNEDAIRKLFYRRGRISLLEDWIEEIHEEALSYEPIEEGESEIKSVKFANEHIEERFKNAWPEIYKYIKEKQDAQYVWCCLHHTLSFYQNIERTSFKIFMRWLNQFAGEQLITEDSIRQYASNYYVKTVTEKWSFEKLEDYLVKNNEKLSSQAQTKYYKYTSMCDDIWEIIRQHN